MYGYAQNTPLTNNPFVSDPTNAQGRYPDISGTSSPPTGQFTSWTQQGQNMGYQSPQLSGIYPQQQQQQQPQYTPGYGVSGFASPMQGPTSPQPFQPTSAFGQQLTAQVNGSSYSYLNPQSAPQQQQQPYRPAMQQLSSPSYVAQFDPYASLGQLESGNSLQVQTALPSQQIQNTGSRILSPTVTSPVSVGPNGQPHPREYIRSHKSEMESWDPYAWKQAIGAFEALKAAWEQRKAEIEARATQLRNQVQYGGGYYSGDQIQQETSRLQGLHKEADLHFGSVAASTFQMQEVFSGYRQSGDLASKRRVREAVNSALQGLPDWPQSLM